MSCRITDHMILLFICLGEICCGNGGIGLNNTTMLAELPIFDTEIQILKISKPYNLFCHSWNPYSMTCGFCPGLLDLQSVGTSSCGWQTSSGALSPQLFLFSSPICFCLWFRILLVYSCCFILFVCFDHLVQTLFNELIVKLWSCENVIF